MRRHIVLLSTWVAVILSSCGGGGTTPAKDEPAPTEEKQPKRKKTRPPAAEKQANEQAFLDYCLQSWTAPKEKQTIAAIEQVLGVNGCEALSGKINEISTLALDGKGIESLAPLGYFTNLQQLSLKKNQVADTAPLKSLQALAFLDASTNRIVDVSPLAALPNLKSVILTANPITDLSPLSKAPRLRSFYFLSEERPDLVKADVAEEDASTAPACEDGYLVDPYRECAHRSFGVLAYNRRQGKVCGIDRTKTKFHSCAHVAHGFENNGAWSAEENVRHYQDRRGFIRTESVEMAEKNATRYCNAYFDEILPKQLNARFGSKAEWYKTRVLAQYLLDNKIPNVSGGNVRHGKFACWLYYRVREGKYVANSPHCGVKGKPVYKSCRHESFGVLHYATGKSAACGTTNIFSVINLNDRALLEKHHGHVLACSTCRDIDAIDTASVQAKLDCYQTNLHSAAPENIRAQTRTALATFFDAKASLFNAKQLRQYALLSVL